MMPHTQYLRIESEAGGVHCTPYQFIRQARRKIAPSCRGHLFREDRHRWMRDGLKQLASAKALVKEFAL